MSRAILMSLAFAACSSEAILQAPSADDAPADTPSDQPFVGTGGLDDGSDAPVATSLDHLGGSFGEVVEFSDELYDVDALIGPGHSMITMHALGEYGWAMLRLQVDGQLGVFPLRAGETVYLSGFSIEPEEEDAPVVDGSVQGCSGPDFWDWTEDTWTEDVSIGLSRDPDTGGLVVTVDAEFANGDHMTGTTVVQ